MFPDLLFFQTIRTKLEDGECGVQCTPGRKMT